MRGRARLVFSAVTVGGICAALVAPSAGLAAVPVTSAGPSAFRAPSRIIRSTRPLVGGRTTSRAVSPETLPPVTLTQFIAPAGRLTTSRARLTTAVVMVATSPPTGGAATKRAALEKAVTTAPPPDAVTVPVPAPAPDPPPVTAPEPVTASPPAVAVDTGSSPDGVWACIREKGVERRLRHRHGQRLLRRLPVLGSHLVERRRDRLPQRSPACGPGRPGPAAPAALGMGPMVNPLDVRGVARAEALTAAVRDSSEHPPGAELSRGRSGPLSPTGAARRRTAR